MKPVFAITLAFISIFYSCSKDYQNYLDDNQNSSKGNEHLFVEITNDIFLDKFMISNEVTEGMFLGSLWSIMDSKDTFNIQKLDLDVKDFKIKVISNSNLNHNPIGYFKPNHQSVKQYANIFNNESFDANVQFHTGAFFDYNVVNSYLTTSSDTKKILDLVKSDNKMYLIKKSSGYFENLLSLNLILTTQYNEFASFFKKELISPLKKDGVSLGYISTVAYGTHSIMMAESNTTQDKLRSVIKKLKNNDLLTFEDSKILEDTSIIFYFRGDDKECFVRKAEGLKQIQDSWKYFSQLNNKTEKNYHYPIWFKLNSLENFGTIVHLWKYNYLDKVK